MNSEKVDGMITAVRASLTEEPVQVPSEKAAPAAQDEEDLVFEQVKDSSVLNNVS